MTRNVVLIICCCSLLALETKSVDTTRRTSRTRRTRMPKPEDRRKTTCAEEALRKEYFKVCNAFEKRTQMDEDVDAKLQKSITQDHRFDPSKLLENGANPVQGEWNGFCIVAMHFGKAGEPLDRLKVWLDYMLVEDLADSCEESNSHKDVQLLEMFSRFDKNALDVVLGALQRHVKLFRMVFSGPDITDSSRSNFFSAPAFEDGLKFNSAVYTAHRLLIDFEKYPLTSDYAAALLAVRIRETEDTIFTSRIFFDPQIFKAFSDYANPEAVCNCLAVSNKIEENMLHTLQKVSSSIQWSRRTNIVADIQKGVQDTKMYQNTAHVVLDFAKTCRNAGKLAEIFLDGKDPWWCTDVVAETHLLKDTSVVRSMLQLSMIALTGDHTKDLLTRKFGEQDGTLLHYITSRDDSKSLHAVLDFVDNEHLSDDLDETVAFMYRLFTEQNEIGQNILHVAASRYKAEGVSREMFEILTDSLEYAAGKNEGTGGREILMQKTAKGRTVLHCAQLGRNRFFADVLDLCEIVDLDMDEAGKDACVRELLEAKDVYGRTPLHEALFQDFEYGSTMMMRARPQLVDTEVDVTRQYESLAIPRIAHAQETDFQILITSHDEVDVATYKELDSSCRTRDLYHYVDCLHAQKNTEGNVAAFSKGAWYAIVRNDIPNACRDVRTKVNLDPPPLQDGELPPPPPLIEEEDDRLPYMKKMLVADDPRSEFCAFLEPIDGRPVDLDKIVHFRKINHMDLEGRDTFVSAHLSKILFESVYRLQNKWIRKGKDPSRSRVLFVEFDFQRRYKDTLQKMIANMQGIADTRRVRLRVTVKAHGHSTRPDNVVFDSGLLRGEEEMTKRIDFFRSMFVDAHTGKLYISHDANIVVTLDMGSCEAGRALCEPLAGVLLPQILPPGSTVACANGRLGKRHHFAPETTSKARDAQKKIYRKDPRTNKVVFDYVDSSVL